MIGTKFQIGGAISRVLALGNFSAAEEPTFAAMRWDTGIRKNLATRLAFRSLLFWDLPAIGTTFVIEEAAALISRSVGQASGAR